MLIFAVLLAVVLINQISTTQLSISDTDASTYVVVPMLMVPIFALFMLKEGIVADVEKRDIVLGAVLFLAAIGMEAYFDATMSYLSFSYRMAALSLPLIIAALSALLFGARNMRRFSFIAVYALFAWPAIFLPVINLEQSFSAINTAIVYSMAKLVVPGLSYVPPISMVLNGTSISIGEACVGIGALIGLVMFLIPLAYFYDASPRERAVWVLTGFALMLVLNIARMLAITTLWFVYGPSQNLISAHSIAGQIMFYGIMAVMVIFSGRFGLSYPSLAGAGRGKGTFSKAGIVVAIVLSLAYLAFSANVASAQQVSPTIASGTARLNFTGGTLIATLDSVANVQNYSSDSFISNGSTSASVYVHNVSGMSQLPIVLIFGQPNATLESEFSQSAFLYKSDQAGNVGKIYELYANGNYSFVYYRRIPYNSGSAVIPADMYVILQRYPYGQGTSCGTASQAMRDAITNAVFLNFPNATDTARIDSAYCFMSKVLK